MSDSAFGPEITVSVECAMGAHDECGGKCTCSCHAADITPERARELLKVWRPDELHADTIRVIAEAFLEAERQLAAVEAVLAEHWDWKAGRSLHAAVRAALGGDHEQPAQGSMDRLAAGKAQRQRFNLGDHEQPKPDDELRVTDR